MQYLDDLGLLTFVEFVEEYGYELRDPDAKDDYAQYLIDAHKPKETN